MPFGPATPPTTSPKLVTMPLGMVKYLLNDGDAAVNCFGSPKSDPTKGINAELVAMIIGGF